MTYSHGFKIVKWTPIEDGSIVTLDIGMGVIVNIPLPLPYSDIPLKKVRAALHIEVEDAGS